MTTEKSKAIGYRYKDERPNPVPEVTGGPRKKKDTRKWCRGKVGIEHQYVVEVDQGGWYGWGTCQSRAEQAIKIFNHEEQKYRRYWWPRSCLHITRCGVCGKVSEHSTPLKNCPDLSDEVKAALPPV